MGEISSGAKIQCLSFVNIALLDIRVAVFYVLGPVGLEFGHANLQPWFHVSIVVNDSSRVYFRLLNCWVVAQSEHMPRLLQRLRQVVECDQTRW